MAMFQISSSLLTPANAAIVNEWPGWLSSLALARGESDWKVTAPSTAVTAQQLCARAHQGANVTWSAGANATGGSELLPSLTPRRPGRDKQWQIAAIQQAMDANLGGADHIGRSALASGLLQINDWLDESHQASQSIEGEGPARSGDYWHAIMHRREPDYGNSKYWFRSVGAHPVFDVLVGHANAILEAPGRSSIAEWRSRLITSRGWEPFVFVDLCQIAAREPSGALGIAARTIQWTEMLLLLAFCWRETRRK